MIIIFVKKVIFRVGFDKVFKTGTVDSKMRSVNLTLCDQKRSVTKSEPLYTGTIVFEHFWRTVLYTSSLMNVYSLETGYTLAFRKHTGSFGTVYQFP